MTEGTQHWVAAWAAAPQGPYPAGNPSAQPDLSLAFANPQKGAENQSFRMVVRPSLWGRALRVRFTNVFGAKPLHLTDLRVGLDGGGGGVIPGTLQVLRFAGADGVTIPAGESRWSDPVEPDFLNKALIGRALAVSFHVTGATGPMTWHAKALQTSYLAGPGHPVTDDLTGLAFPYSTTSWFFIDCVDMDVPGGKTIAAFGDSLTDGTFSTLNGHDRWPDVFLRRLQAVGRTDVAVVNQGIGGNQVIGPAHYDLASPVPGGPSALDRLARDLLGLSGLHAVIWLEGTNDCSANGCGDAEAIMAGLIRGVAMLRAARPGLRIFGGTLPGTQGSSAAGHGHAAQDLCRRRLNALIRGSSLFDAVFDFEAATTDVARGALRPAFVPDSTIGGPGDGLHPNRAGYAAMAAAIPLDLFET